MELEKALRLRKCQRCKKSKPRWQFPEPAARRCSECLEQIQRRLAKSKERRREYQRNYQRKRRKQNVQNNR